MLPRKTLQHYTERKFLCSADLLFYQVWFSHKCKSVDIFIITKLLNPNQSNRRSTVRWYFPFWFKLVFSALYILPKRLKYLSLVSILILSMYIVHIFFVVVFILCRVVTVLATLRGSVINNFLRKCDTKATLLFYFKTFKVHLQSFSNDMLWLEFCAFSFA